MAALSVLRDVGITVGQFDATEWNPAEKDQTPGNRGRSEAMRMAHQAAAYNAWLASEVQDAIDDSRANLSFARERDDRDGCRFRARFLYLAHLRGRQQPCVGLSVSGQSFHETRCTAPPVEAWLSVTTEWPIHSADRSG